MRLRRTTFALAALLALNAALWLAQGGLGGVLADGVGALFGPRLVRAEVVLKDRTGVHVYRVDRGRLAGLSQRSLTLLERDGTTVTIPVAPAAQIRVDGSRAPFAALRRRMFVETVREADGPAVRVVASSTGPVG